MLITSKLPGIWSIFGIFIVDHACETIYYADKI